MSMKTRPVFQKWVLVLGCGVLAAALPAFGELIPEPQSPPTPPAAPTAPAPMFSQAPVVAMIGSGSYLGVGVREIDEERARTLKLKETHGVEITRVDDESPAHKAGLKSGDVVLEYNGDRVEGIEQFVRLVRETPANRTVKLSVFREGSVQALTATVGSRRVLKPWRGAPFRTLPAWRNSRSTSRPWK